MEAVTSACPAHFSGAAGAAFAHAVSAVLAAHCALADPERWPPDAAPAILQAGSDNEQYDFVVVGAGTAGSLVASRLSQMHDWSVLLVEAGDDPTLDSEVPAFLFNQQNTKSDWNYTTSEDSSYCLSQTEGRCKWAKGKVMGGSSSINAMLYVRGNKRDFDKWEALGNVGWSYDSVLPYFKRTENFRDRTYNNNSKYHNTEGELYIQRAKENDPRREFIASAWIENGYQYNEDINSDLQLGITHAQLSIKDGRRHNSAKSLLHQANLRGSLKVMKKSYVQKIIIDPMTNKTYGAEIRHENGALVEVKAKKEVIISAGSIGTPQLLMLSGIGPKSELINVGITPLIDLPAGENLQDHCFLPLFLKLNAASSQSISKEAVELLLIQYMLTRQGPFSGIGVTDLLAFINSGNSSDLPDLQFHHIYYNKDDRVVLPSYLHAAGYTGEVIETIKSINKDHDLIGIYPTLLHPKSRGKILIRSLHADVNPIIKPNYLKDPSDVDTLLKGITIAKSLAKTPAFSRVGAELVHLNLKGCSHFLPDSNDYWECYMRHMATTIYHPVGTAKMGPACDKTAVVDFELKVHGVEGLRVADASIMPTIPSGNTMAPTLMIAEKAVDLIEKQWYDQKKLHCPEL